MMNTTTWPEMIDVIARKQDPVILSNYDWIMKTGGYPLLFAILIGFSVAVPALNYAASKVLAATTEGSDLWNVAIILYFITNPMIIYQEYKKRRS